MKRSQISVQTILSVLALCISVFAAFFSWQQVADARAHNRLSVRPLLHLIPYAEGKGGRNGLYLENVGLGPAIFKELRVKSGNMIAYGFDSDQSANLLAAAGVNVGCFKQGWPKYESAVKAGEALALFQITKAEGSEACAVEMIKLMGGHGLDVVIGYESMYGESRTLSENSRVKSETIQFLHQKLFGK